MTCQVRLNAPTQRALASLPLGVAHAAVEFIYGPLAENPHRVGKPLHGKFDGQHGARRGSYGIRYRVAPDGSSVDVLDITHRADAYR